MRSRLILTICLLLCASGLHARAFVVTWNPNPPADSVFYYRTYRNDTLIYTGLDTFAVDTELENGVKYWYQVEAVNRHGVSPQGAAVYGMWLSWQDNSADSLHTLIRIGWPGLYQITPPPGDDYTIEFDKSGVTMWSTFDVNGDGYIDLIDFAAVARADSTVPGGFVAVYGRSCVWRGEK